jgi:hypothetical protein
VSRAGLVLLRRLADKTGLTEGLSRALATPWVLVHDRGRVTADLACAVADGARVISDFRVMRDQRELFGLVASVPTAWRTLKEIALGGVCADRRITAAVNTARWHAWARVAARHGALPGGQGCRPGRFLIRLFSSALRRGSAPGKPLRLPVGARADPDSWRLQFPPARDRTAQGVHSM